MSLKVVKDMKPQKATRTTVDTIVITPASVELWKNPPFQRPLRINDKVQALAETIKVDKGVLPGIITLGVLDREKYLLDGQHRRAAFLMSGCPEGFTDIRLHHFDDMADMGEEFVRLNSQLVHMRPDDILRGLEGSNAALAKIRKDCPYVGYDMIRRNAQAPIVSMSTLLRCWFGSSPEVPSNSGFSAPRLGKSFTDEDAVTLVGFLRRAMEAWSRDVEYQRLWGSLNLTLCMWLFRRMVVTQYSPKTPKLTGEQFAKCLMALSANPTYVDWLVGRQLRDRDRSPAYSRVKQIFAERIKIDTGKKALLPSPAWSSHAGSGKK